MTTTTRKPTVENDEKNITLTMLAPPAVYRGLLCRGSNRSAAQSRSAVTSAQQISPLFCRRMCNVSVRLSALVFFVVFWLKNEKDERTKRQTNRYQQQQQLYSMLSHASEYAGRRRCRSSSLKKSRSTLTAGNEQAQWRQARYRLCVCVDLFF